MTDQATSVQTQEPTAMPVDNSIPASTTPPVQETPTVTAPASEPVVTEQTTPTKTSSILPNTPTEPALELTDEIKQKIAGGNEKIMKELNKYKTLDDVIKSKMELQTQFSKTRPLPQLPKDATDEQVKEYREAAGIPESWEKYDLTLDKGLVIGEEDKTAIEPYLKKFHEANLRPDDVKKVMQIHFEHQNQIASEAIKKAEEHENETKNHLREQLGPKYEERMQMTTDFIKNTLGEDVLNKLMGAVAPDGTYLIADPKILNHFLDISKNHFGTPTNAPIKGADMTSILTRKTELEKISSSNPKLWFDNQELRSEYNEILETLKNKK